MYGLNQPVVNEPEPPFDPAAEFRERLAGFTPVVFVTWAILGINVLVFLAMFVSGVSPVQPTTDNLLRWGANFGPRTVTAGEWWRLFTSMFLHIGIIHIAFNMYVLYQIGPFMERLLGRLGFLIVYLLSGLAGAMASLVWNPYGVSAGASGAIFGLYGALLGFLSLRRESVPQEVLSGLIKSALIFIGYNVVYGLVQSNVDLAAHAGGLVAGGVCGLAISSPLTLDYPKRRRIRAAALALAGGALILAGAARLPRPVDFRPELEKFTKVEAKTLGAYKTLFTRAQKDKLSERQVADGLERDIIPEWAAEREALAKLKGLPDRQKRVVSALLKYMDARQQAWSMLATGLRTHNLAMVREAGKQQVEAQNVLKEFGKAAR